LFSSRFSSNYRMESNHDHTQYVSDWYLGRKGILYHLYQFSSRYRLWNQYFFASLKSICRSHSPVWLMSDLSPPPPNIVAQTRAISGDATEKPPVTIQKPV
jgi:hypothetical protein